MSWNGQPVIDLDSHIVERVDRFYRDYLDPAYHDAYQQVVKRPGLTERAKQKMLSENALRLCPRLRA